LFVSPAIVSASEMTYTVSGAALDSTHFLWCPHQSLNGLSLPDLWLTCDHFAGKVSAYESANHANSAFHPSEVGNYMDYRGGDHQTADQDCVWLFGCRSKSVGAGLARPLCLWHNSAAAAVVWSQLWRYVSVICLFLCYF